MSWIDMHGNVAVVTGAGAGIGRGIAMGLAEVGATLVLLDRDEEACSETLAQISKTSPKAIAITCDVTSPDSIGQAAARSLLEVGPAHILVNNAGRQTPGGLDKLTFEAWQATLALNLNGYFLCAQAFGAQMIEAGEGSIVHIASISASFPQGHSGAYSVSKAEIVMLSKQLATEWGGYGIRSNVVSPGLIETPMTREIYAVPGVRAARQALVPRGRIGAPRDIANAVVFLASPRADYLTGEELTVDGGFTRMMMNVIPRPGFERRSEK